MDEKKELLKEIQELLNKYNDTLEMSPYVLEYLSCEELENIKKNILKKQETVISDNLQWLEQFKTKDI